jgi:hypothetical protein
MAAAAVACRRALLLHGHQQWPQRWAAAAPCPRTISQLVKTNGRRAFLVDTLALVSLRGLLLPLFRLPRANAGRAREVFGGMLRPVADAGAPARRDGRVARRSGSWSRRACLPSRRRRSPPPSRRSSTTASRASPSPSSPRPRCRR